MAAVLHRNTLEFHASAHTPHYSPATWIHNPDLSAVEGVPKEHWKIDGDAVVEMDQGEKDTVAVGKFAAQVRAKFREIDGKTERLIDAGFEYPPASGQFFSLSTHAQITLLGADTNREVLTYPVTFNTKDDDGELEIADKAAMNAFFLSAMVAVRSHLDTGTVLKAQVRAATEKSGLDAIADDRT